MKKSAFKQYLTEKETFKDGVYISVSLSPESTKELENYMASNLPDFKLEEPHATLIYSQKPLSITPKTKQYKIKATFAGFDLFGPDNNVLVIKLSSPDLVLRNKELVDEYGFVSDFAEYSPHCTIIQKYGEDVSNLPDITFPLYFENETAEPLDIGWAN